MSIEVLKRLAEIDAKLIALRARRPTPAEELEARVRSRWFMGRKYDKAGIAYIGGNPLVSFK